MKILYYPAPVLRQRAAEVRNITDDICAATKRMAELMHEADGVGLAAPQVGISQRFVVVRKIGADDEVIACINPVIVESEGSILEEEGCLSFPGLRGKVRRAERVLVKAYDLDGNEIELEAGGLGARLWQHEVDHLNGDLFIDKLSPASRLRLMRRIKQLEEEYREGR